MSTIDYSQQAVLARFSELEKQQQEAALSDPAVKEAKRALDAAQRNVEREPSSQSYLDLEAAQKTYNAATNEFWKTQRLADLEAQKVERQKQLEAEQKARAAQLEAEAKEDYRPAYLAAGGTNEQFEKAWPDLWKRELERRADEERRALVERMHRTVGYSGF